MEQPILRFYKSAENSKNKIVIPKYCIDNLGRDYYLEVYKDYIKLVPVKKEK